VQLKIWKRPLRLINLITIFVGSTVFVLTAFAQSLPPSSMPSTAAGETTVLTLYPRSTQIGTIARRAIRDRWSKLTREVFYTARADESGGPTEKDLLVQLIKVYYYDDAVRVDHVEHWERGNRLDRVEHNKYDSSGELARRWFVEADGVRRYEMRFSSPKKLTDLYFDNTGTYLTSLRGQLVTDVDLPHGWGVINDGVACGISLSTERGRFDEIGVWVNIKNVASETIHIDNLPEPSFELFAANGSLIPQHPAGSKSSAQLYGQLLGSNEAGYVYPSYKIADYYNLLPPGKYTIRIRQSVSERKLQLNSNEETFVIVSTTTSR
jgi:hypothetical protein